MYKCECGKEFDNPQKFNGHKSHCAVHLAAVGKLDYYSIRQNKSAQLARIARKKNCADRRAKKDILWNTEQHFCEHCGKVMLEKYGSGRFCSKACASSKECSEETKRKIASSLAGRVPANKSIDYIKAHTCIVCGKLIKKKTKTGMCQDCLRHSSAGKALTSATGKLVAKEYVEAGKNKPWQSRNITSYPEKFFKEVLDNNSISYVREAVVLHEKSRYFLDFLITKNNKNIDLEIDGKQHTYEDRKNSDEIRDKFLTDQNYIVYRIPWNEINSDNGKLRMKEKIDNFLEFYNSI